MSSPGRAVYHTLNPHPGLSPVPESSDPEPVVQQAENEAVYRQLLIHGALAVVLPTEELENACLRTMVGDVLADLLLGNEISGRICEGWFLWEAITKLLDILENENDREKSRNAEDDVQQDRLKKFGLISTKKEREEQMSQSPVYSWIWTFLSSLSIIYVVLRFTVTGLFRVATTPPVSLSTSMDPTSRRDEAPTSPGYSMAKRPVVDYRLYSMASQMMNVPQRMPWLTGMLALLQYFLLDGPGKPGGTGGVFDR